MCKRHVWVEMGWQGKLFCEKCGISKEDAESGRYSKKQAKRAGGSVSVSNAQKRGGSENSSLYVYAVNLTKQIISEQGGKCAVVMTRGKGARHVRKNDGQDREIRYGYQAIDLIAEHGHIEYKTWMFLWRDYGYSYKYYGRPCEDMKGKLGIWALVLHECAHYFQAMRVRGSSHNYSWAQEVERLQALYPAPVA